MALPHDEWLHLAKRLPVGRTQRFYHRNERRPNLVVSNTSDRYAVYCQACKEGGVVMKEHVVITGKPAPALSADLTLPTDLVKVVDAEPCVISGVLGFIAHKNMDAQYLPELWFSRSRSRVLIEHQGEWLGRDTTERSPQKWLTYNGSNHLAHPEHHPIAIVVEDPFSFFKVSWALQFHPISVYSSLGTALSDELMLRLLEHDMVFLMYDGDRAGYDGAFRESRRLQSCGVNARDLCAPQGMDPKDMGILEIRSYFGVK